MRYAHALFRALGIVFAFGRAVFFFIVGYFRAPRENNQPELMSSSTPAEYERLG